MTDSLTNLEIAEVKKMAREKLGDFRKSKDVIGTQVFSILSFCTRVIYYPLGAKAPWGFTRLSGKVDDSRLERPFVVINTSIPVSAQVFAAAHELYHIWYENGADSLSANLLEEQSEEKNERKANRFAAEFLMDEIILRQEMDVYNLHEMDMKSVLTLANLFQVPFRAMVKRLREVSFIDEKKEAALLSVTRAEVLQYQKRYGISEPEPDGRIVLDNLVDLAMKAYDGKHITYEKLEYLVSIGGLSLEEVGIRKDEDLSFPSDEELDSIMEEDE